MLTLEGPRACERMAECIAYAKQHHLVPALAKVLDYLGTYSERTTRCALGAERDVPLSFRFIMFWQVDGLWKPWFHGGLMFEGPGQSLNGSAPAFTVNIGAPTHGWSVHT